MTYIYAHFFSNRDKYVGISNNPEQRWKNGFDSNNVEQYNHKVLIANEKYDKLSLVISEDLPRRIAETLESILINEYDEFNLNIKMESQPNLHGNNVICMFTENFSHVYPKIDDEILYYSSEIEKKNKNKLKPIIMESKKEQEKIRQKLLKEEEKRTIEKQKSIERRRAAIEKQQIEYQNREKEKIERRKKERVERKERLEKERNEDLKEKLNENAENNGLVVMLVGNIYKKNEIGGKLAELNLKKEDAEKVKARVLLAWKYGKNAQEIKSTYESAIKSRGYEQKGITNKMNQEKEITLWLIIFMIILVFFIIFWLYGSIFF